MREADQAVSGVILFAHGARDPQWALPFQRLLSLVAARQHGAVVTLAFLELMSPTLEQAVLEMVGAGISSIQVVPLFLGPGAHFRRDFPALLADMRQRYPQLTLTSTAVLGESDALLNAIAEWIDLSLQAASI